jgi:hypothetical protein
VRALLETEAMMAAAQSAGTASSQGGAGTGGGGTGGGGGCGGGGSFSSGGGKQAKGGGRGREAKEAERAERLEAELAYQQADLQVRAGAVLFRVTGTCSFVLAVSGSALGGARPEIDRLPPVALPPVALPPVARLSFCTLLHYTSTL